MGVEEPIHWWTQKANAVSMDSAKAFATWSTLRPNLSMELMRQKFCVSASKQGVAGAVCFRNHACGGGPQFSNVFEGE